MRHCVSAGEPLNPEVIRIWEEGTRGLTIYDGYGQTETVNLVANYRCMPVRPGSMGKPTPGFDVRIVSETGDTLGVHVIGPHATDLIAEATLAFSLEATPWEIGGATHPHPTLSEVVGEAALAVDGRSINF